MTLRRAKLRKVAVRFGELASPYGHRKYAARYMWPRRKSVREEIHVYTCMPMVMVIITAAERRQSRVSAETSHYTCHSDICSEPYPVEERRHHENSVLLNIDNNDEHVAPVDYLFNL